MENLIISVVGAMLSVLLPSLFVYAVIMFINNVIWGYKGITIDKKTEIYKKRRRNLFGISILISIGGLIAWGSFKGNIISPNYHTSTNTVSNSKEVTFDNCEFKVNFPTETKQKNVSQSGIEYIRIESVHEKLSPYLRAECIPLPENNIKKMAESLPQTMRDQAQQFGIENPEITTEKTASATIGQFSGIRKVGQIKVMCVGKIYVGNTSSLMLVATESESQYPSDKLLFFLNSVTAR
jgi:hypothetical protein